MSPSTGDADGGVYGLLAIHGVEVALPLDELREVIPAPAGYQPVPMSARGLLGAIVLRGLIIPVLDIGDRMGDLAHAPDPADQVVAIVVHGDDIVGVLADGVRGVVEVPPARLQRLVAPDVGRPLFPVCFHRTDTDTVTSVLDAAALMELPGIPVASRTGWSLVDDAAAAGETTTMMLFEVAGALFALDVAHVTTVLPAVDLRPSVLDGALCRGVTAHLDLHIPVADLLALVGLGALPAADVRQGVVLGLERGLVALALSDMHAVVRVGRRQLGPLPALGIDQSHRFAGLYTAEDGRHYLVLDGDRLARDPELDTLSALNTSATTLGPVDTTADGRDDAEGRARAGATYLTFDIGAPVATPLGEVAEILGYPEDLIAATSSHPAVTATFVHRGEAVPLVDLAALLRPSRPRPVDRDSRLLVVDAAGRRLAFAVAELHAIEPSVWEMATDGPAPDSLPGLLAEGPLLEFAGEGAQRLVPRVSLLDVAAHLLPRPVATEPTDATLLERDPSEPSV